MSAGGIISLYPLVQQHVVLSHRLYLHKLIMPLGVDVTEDFEIKVDYGGQYFSQQSSSEPRWCVQKLVNLTVKPVMFESKMLH